MVAISKSISAKIKDKQGDITDDEVGNNISHVSGVLTLSADKPCVFFPYQTIGT